MSNASHDQICDCPDCSCRVAQDGAYPRDGKAFCSQACADLHPDGHPCPSDNCHCERGVSVEGRSVSDAKLDQAVEETFPASDPISP